MIIDFILVALAFYFSIPLIAGYFAKSYGRSFWVWFTISTFLPIITHFILFFLVYSDERILAKNRLTKREKKESNKLIRELVSETKISPPEKEKQREKESDYKSLKEGLITRLPSSFFVKHKQ
ncbi:MAG: hypothetical protein AAGA66_09870 [Bacteroidota bacterium]